MPPIYFHGNYNRYKEHNLLEQIVSYKTLFFDVVTTIGYALSPAMNKSLHAAIVRGPHAGMQSITKIIVKTGTGYYKLTIFFSRRGSR